MSLKSILFFYQGLLIVLRRYSNALNILFIILLTFGPVSAKKWVGTWSCAPYAAGTNTPPPPYLANNTLRQIVRVSIGGDTIRIKFSNGTSSTPVTMKSVNIAVSTEVGGSAIDVSTITQLKFNGDTSVTMNAYSTAISDPLLFSLTPGMHLAISIYYGQISNSSDMTFHYGSRTDSYILAGNQTALATFDGATIVERWYTINTIDVLAPDTCATVAILGNSITDGYGLHGGLKNLWTDIFSQALLDNPPTSHVGVLNLGIGATWFSTSGVSRFQQDVLDQAGVRWAFIFYGVNDIGGNASADDIIGAYKNVIARAHAQNVRVYGATITPFNGSNYYSGSHEAVRAEVNKWIRTPGNVDECIDFDKAIRDPADTTKLLAVYSNDWLHPNANGHNLLGKFVDLNLFLGGDTLFPQPVYEGHYFETECGRVGKNWNIIEDANASNGRYVTVKAGIQSLQQAPTGDENAIVIPITVDSADSYNLYARINCPTYDDDSFWLKMDDLDYSKKNDLVTTGWGWIYLGNYILTEGEHILTIAYREDGALLDKIYLSNNPMAPSDMGEEAENLCDPANIKIPLKQPEEYGLIQNFPNPFNPVTNIKYYLSHRDKVSLIVLDMTGRTVKILTNNVQNMGEHSVIFNGSGLASGLYFYQLRTSDGFTQSKKMLLVK